MTLIVDCEGSGRQRGRAHGEAIRELVRQSIEQWRSHVETTRGCGLAHHVDEVLGSTSFVDTSRRLCPDLFEELQGIAEGAGTEERLIVAYNLMDELWWFPHEDREASSACTAVAIQPLGRDGEAVLLGQNMDLPAFMDGTQIMLRIRPAAGPEALVLSSAGLLGLAGVTRQGLGVCVNALQVLNHSTNGLPVAFVVRALLACQSLDEAIQLVSTLPHASGQHYLIADVGKVASFECSAGGVVPCEPLQAGFYAHTNHALASEDFDETQMRAELENGDAAESTARLEFVRERGQAIRSLATIAGVLSDRTVPVCFVPSAKERSCTFGSVLYRLTEPPTVAARLGLPDRAPWTLFGWKDEPESPVNLEQLET